jgi:SnoaL-like domain
MSGAWPSWQAAAEVEIRALVQRYNALGDSGRFEEFIDLFASDARYVVTGRDTPFDGHDGIGRLLEEASDDLKEWGVDRPFYIRHFTSTHQIDFDGPDDATGRVYYQCLMPHGLDHWGRYTDRYGRIDGRWRFAARTEARDGMVDGGWCHMLWGPQGTRRQLS